MLIKRVVQKLIAEGQVTLAFRHWRRPTVKAGGRLRTGVGELAIEAVDIVVDEKSLTEADARRAGFASRQSLRADLRAQRPGTLYRIRFRLAGPDAREVLREKAVVGAAEMDEIVDRLNRLDAASRTGAWTRQALRAIENSPGVRASVLAAAIGQAPEKFKLNVRKLKELGLTASLTPGYRLSPRGRTVWKRLRRG